jgi:hypothetical protein
LLDAIFFAHPSFSNGVWSHIIRHRLKEIEANEDDEDRQLPVMKSKLRQFSRGDIEFPDLREAMRDTFPNDLIVPIMDRF